MAQEQPRTIGRYEVVDRIGRGGMGVVFKAKDPRIGRQVAIKLLSVPDESLRDRFVQEAQSVGSLAHRNIVTIFDFGEHEGQSYIVMEYVEGVTLQEQIHESVPIPMWRKLEIIEELASGLDYAHNKGIVHRDVKPANVMTDREGVVKILDFGIARVGNITMTQAGMMLGTPNYMSPEQFESGRVDRRSDIFSVGVLLYELIAYRKAFTGEAVWDVMKAVMSKTPPPLSDIVPGIDPAIEAAVARAIEKDPAKRYQTLAEMSADLTKARSRIAYRQAARDSDTVLAPPPHDAPRTPRPSTDRELISRRRAERIDEYLKDAQTAFDAGEFGTAVEACDQALLLDPDDGRIHSLMDRARRALDHQQAVEVLADARSALERSDLEKAAALVDQAIQLDASFHDARAFKGTVDERIRQRDAEHKKRQEELAAAQQMVLEQKRQFAAGHWHEALGALERYTPRHEVIAGAIADLRTEMAELDRRAREEEEQQKRDQAEAQRRWVARQFDLAKRAMANQQFVEAIEILEHVKRNSSAAPGLTDLLKQAVQGKSAAEEAIRRKEEIAQILQRAAAEAGRGKLLEARSLVASALSIDPAHPEALDKLREIKNAIDAEERQKQDAARQREAERLRLEKEEAAAAEARAKKEQEIVAAAARAQRERDAAAAEARAKQEREAAAAAAAAAAEAEARVKREKEAAAAAEARARKEQEAAAAARAKAEREAAAAAEARAKKERKAAAAAKKEQEAAEARAKKDRDAAAAAQAKQERDAATKPAPVPSVAPPSATPSAKSTTISPPVAPYTPAESPQPHADASSSAASASALSQLASQATKLPPKILAAAGGGLVLLLAIVYYALSGGSTPEPNTPPPASSQTAATPTPAPATIPAPAPAPAAAPPTAAPPAPATPSPEQQLVEIRSRARQQFGRGDWQNGVATANEGLELRKDDPELQKVLSDALAAARSQMTIQRNLATAVGRTAIGTEAFQAGMRRQRSVEQLQRSGQPTGAVRAAREAEDLYKQAYTEGRRVAQKDADATKPPIVAAPPLPNPGAGRSAAPPTPSSTQAAPAQQPTPIPAQPPPAPAPAAPEPPAVTRPTPPAGPPPAAPAVPNTAADQSAIRAVLQAYADAYSQLNTAAVKRVYPGVNEGGLKTSFGNLKSQQVAIVNEQFVNLTDSQATVTCTWQVAYVGSAGGQQRSSPKITIRLQKTNGGWVIVDRR
jgi:hypothetical protein